MRGKPELLLPVGNIETFYAAIEGGADAVYLGLKQFNARGRAANFLPAQLVTLTEIAKQRGVKVFVTLNTVIKNRELPELIDTLHFLSKTAISAVIIQDWGSYYLLKNYFPTLVYHASTQMANHNSVGVNFSRSLGFDRVILARELTKNELHGVMKKASAEVEIFIHGALCYSFSGMCLFSSYLGGQGANRGQCAQPCRRLFDDGVKERFIFSLKDNQQLKNIADFTQWGVASLKVEGRMKSSEYVYRVARAYRMIIDDPTKLEEAGQLLAMDFGREKTNYFMGSSIARSLSQSPLTGVYLDKVRDFQNGTFKIKSAVPLETRYRLRLLNREGKQVAFKIKELSEDKGIYTIHTDKACNNGDRVYLAGMPEKKFPAKFEQLKNSRVKPLPNKVKQRFLSELKFKPEKRRPEIFVRIDSLGWLRKIRLDEMDALILSLSRKELEEIRLDAPFLKKNAHKIYFELPGFISEKKMEWYQQWAKRTTRQGYQRFFISHLSQIDLLPAKSIIATNEQVYTYNDAATKMVLSKGIKLFTFPVENDFENLTSGTNRSGLVPVYSTPELFYSRMPVKIKNETATFKDDNGNTYHRIVRDGLTSVYPAVPMAWLHYGNKLKQEGFFRFLFDLKGQSPSKHLLPRLLKKFKAAEQIQPSTTFNFKRGLG